MSSEINRREFSAAATAAAFTLVPRHVLGGPGYIAPSDKLTLAHIGFGTQAIREVGPLLNDPNLQVTAMCDVEKDGVNYLEWSKGEIRDTIRKLISEPNWRAGKDWCPGGRDVGKELVETFYEKKGQNVKVNTYADFREMLEKEKDLDIVKVMTPDHLHMFASLAAMKKGKHVMVHKPLANRLFEGRLIVDAAKKLDVKTHFLPASENPNVKMVKDWIDMGAIGTLREIHNWSARPFWPQYLTMPTDRPPIPKDFNWELWQGPVPDRPYHPWYTHTTFRGWMDYGGGSLPDMGIYSMWPIYRMFDLDAPYYVETCPSTAYEAVDGVSRPIKNDYAFPLAAIARMRYAAKGSRPAIDIFWYDGGMKPPTPEEMEGKPLPREGMMFVGDKGKILGGFRTENAQLIPRSKMEDFARAQNFPAPPPLGTRPQRPQGGSMIRPNALVEAIKSGTRSYGDFSYAGPITDGHCLVAISYRLGGVGLSWDAAAKRITNNAEANKYLAREYRQGWEPETGA